MEASKKSIDLKYFIKFHIVIFTVSLILNALIFGLFGLVSDNINLFIAVICLAMLLWIQKDKSINSKLSLSQKIIGILILLAGWAVYKFKNDLFASPGVYVIYTAMLFWLCIPLNLVQMKEKKIWSYFLLIWLWIFFGIFKVVLTV